MQISAQVKKYHYFVAALGLSILVTAVADEDERTGPVGYCAGPPCCNYEHQSCSESDNATLIAQSKIVKGNRKLCTALMKTHWNYLPLDRAHTVSSDEAAKFLALRGATTDIWPKAGYFDINNDGKPEYLVWMTAYSGAGQGCDIEMYAEVDGSLSRILDSPLTKLLADNTCRTYQRAFRFGGKVYIENRRTLNYREDLMFLLPSVLTEIYIIEGHKKRSVCRFDLRDAKD
jgi:hypothetical protein